MEKGVTTEVLNYKLDAISVDIAEIRREQREQLLQIRRIESAATRDKGFVGGALFIILGLWAALTSFREVILDMFK